MTIKLRLQAPSNGSLIAFEEVEFELLSSETVGKVETGIAANQHGVRFWVKRRNGGEWALGYPVGN